MSTSFFVRRKGIEDGPFTAHDLRSFVRDGSLCPEDRIRKADSTKWVEASRVQGLWPSSSPLPATTPSAPEITDGPVARSPPTTSEALNFERLADAQRWLIRSLLLGFVAIVLWPLLILVIPLQIYCTARLVRLLNWDAVPVAATVTGTLVPYIGLVPLLIANQSATRVLRQAGYIVGFLGARPASNAPVRVTTPAADVDVTEKKNGSLFSWIFYVAIIIGGLCGVGPLKDVRKALEEVMREKPPAKTTPQRPWGPR